MHSNQAKTNLFRHLMWAMLLVLTAVVITLRGRNDTAQNASDYFCDRDDCSNCDRNLNRNPADINADPDCDCNCDADHHSN